MIEDWPILHTVFDVGQTTRFSDRRRPLAVSSHYCQRERL